MIKRIDSCASFKKNKTSCLSCDCGLPLPPRFFSKKTLTLLEPNGKWGITNAALFRCNTGNTTVPADVSAEWHWEAEARVSVSRAYPRGQNVRGYLTLRLRRASILGRTGDREARRGSSRTARRNWRRSWSGRPRLSRRFRRRGRDDRRRERGERRLRLVLRAAGRLQDDEGTLSAAADATGGGGGGEHVSQARVRQGHVDGRCQG